MDKDIKANTLSGILTDDMISVLLILVLDRINILMCLVSILLKPVVI